MSSLYTNLENTKDETVPTAGFDLIELSLKKFMSYDKETNITFDTPTLVLTGPTGSGKTTILDAITFALYGRSTRTDRRATIKDICREGGHVKLVFSTGTDTLTVTRGVLKKGSKSFLVLEKNGQRISGKIAELNREIIQQVGLGYDAFVSASFIRQDEMKLLGSKTDIERLTTLQNLFRLDVFNNLSDVLKEERKNDERNKVALESKMAEKKRSVQDIPILETDIRQHESDIKILNEQATKLEKDITELQEKVKQFEKFKEQYVEIKTRIEKDFKRRQERQQKILEINDEQKIRQKLLEEIKGLEEQVKDIDELLVAKGDLEKRQLKFRHIEQQYQAKLQEIERLKSMYRQQIQEKDSFMKDKQTRIELLPSTLDHQQAFNLLRKEGRLLERIERIEKEIEWLKNAPDILKGIETERKVAEEDLTEVSSKTGSITKDSFLLSEIKDDLKNLEKQKQLLINQQETSNKKLLEELKALELEKNKQKFGSEQLNSMELLNEKLRLKNAAKNRLKEKQGDLSSRPDRETLLESLKQEIKELFKTISDNQEKEEQLREKANEYTGEKQRLDQLNQQQLELAKKLSGLEATLKQKKNLKTQLDIEKKNIEQLQKELDDLNLQIKIKTILIEDVFHQKGIPFFAVNKLLPRIGKKASIILANITDDRYNNVVLEKTTGTKRFGFEIKVDTPQGYRDIATFSGGERTQINAAVRLAISEELAQLGGGKSAIGFKTLFIDEGDLGSLDTAKSQKLFVQKLFSLTDKFNKIILVTHLSEISEQFENSMQVSIDNKGHSIIVKSAVGE